MKLQKVKNWGTGIPSDDVVLLEDQELVAALKALLGQVRDVSVALSRTDACVIDAVNSLPPSASEEAPVTQQVRAAIRDLDRHLRRWQT